MDKDQLTERLLEIAQDYPQGFTVYLHDLSFVKSGWVVGLKETQNSFGISGLSHVIDVATEKTGIVGGWDYDGKFWWDAVRIFDSEEEATKFGIENEPAFNLPP